jgi:hypothetical protein
MPYPDICTSAPLGATGVSTQPPLRSPCLANLLERFDLKTPSFVARETEFTKQIGSWFGHVSDFSVDHRRDLLCIFRPDP